MASAATTHANTAESGTCKRCQVIERVGPTLQHFPLPDSPRWQYQLVPPKDYPNWSLAERFAHSKEIWFPLAKVHFLPHLLWPSQLIKIMARGQGLSMKKKSVLLNTTISTMISGLSVSRNGRKMCYCSSILLGHCYTLEQNKKQEVSMPSHPCNDNFSHVGTWKIDVPTTCSIVMSIESCFF